MTYHTNFSWINRSIWENESFSGVVAVYFGKYITQTKVMPESFSNIINPDWNNLVQETIFYDENKYQRRLDMLEAVTKHKLNLEEIDKTSEEYLKEMEELKEDSYSKTNTLKDEVIDWLNNNVKNKKNVRENTPLNEKKGWGIGNLEYNSKDSNNMFIVFERQLDALKFIRKFSIFKEPLFYFDYFNDREKKYMDLNKILHILNKELENKGLEKIIVNQSDIIETDQGDTNLDPMTFSLKNWETKKDDIDLNEKQKVKFIKSLYSIDNDNIKDISYENNNLTKYEINNIFRENKIC